MGTVHAMWLDLGTGEPGGHRIPGPGQHWALASYFIVKLLLFVAESRSCFRFGHFRAQLRPPPSPQVSSGHKRCTPEYVLGKGDFRCVILAAAAAAAAHDHSAPHTNALV
uniref:Uncharacterized protein n=1 Tax=Anopheles coluzzii TaxID=1518534 RepID=A0A8W7P3E9_ANOCL